MKTTSLIQMINISIAYVAAVTMGVSGLIHFSQPFQFAGAVASYGMLPGWGEPIVVVVLPAVQVSTAGWLLAFPRNFSLNAVSLALFTIFFVAQGYALSTGRDISCGCFGAGSHVVSEGTIAVPAAGVLLTAFVLITSRWPMVAKYTYLRDRGFPLWS